jgi:rare lipoprotein A
MKIMCRSGLGRDDGGNQLMTLNKIFLVLLGLSLIGGCSTVQVKSSPELIGYKESGNASFYSKRFEHKMLASGEQQNQYSKTAAHRTLPFGTKVKVKNVKNGKSVVVRINDRGPFGMGLLIYLSRAAFSSIGNIDSGFISVEIEVVE